VDLTTQLAALKAQLATLRDLDPDALTEAQLRDTVPRLVGFSEACVGTLHALHAEVHRLQDEIARLKGEQGRPKPPRGRGDSSTGNEQPTRGGGIVNPVAAPTDHSSEAERRTREPRPGWKKSGKLARLTVTRDQLCPWTGPLPAGVEFKGYEPVVVQDLVLQVHVVRFLRAKFYDPATRKTYLGPLPPGYAGQYGPGVKTLALALGYRCHLSQPLLHDFFTDAGLLISHGQVTRLVTEGLDAFHAEQAAVLAAGLRSSPWHHLDLTSTRVAGENYACHVLGNPLYAHYHTTPRQDRMSALDVLRGGAPRRYRLDATAFAHLQATHAAVRVVAALSRWEQETTWSEAAFGRLLDLRLPRLGKEARQQVLEAAAIAAYWADPGWPVVQCLVADDAAQLRGLTPELALCWIHDGRHYTKLNPQFACHRRALQRFRKRYWDFYRELLAYQRAPAAAEALRLEAAFDTLFATAATYADLARCIERTRANKAKLLGVLTHPELPLHNNPAELLARRRVRKRDVSFGPRSPTGLRAWDTFQGLVETTRKLGIRFWDYLQDRLTQAGQLPPLAEVIAERAEALQLGASWAAP
jgi:hypothetical protein